MQQFHHVSRDVSCGFYELSSHCQHHHSSLFQDYADTELLLSRANVDQAALLSYAREAADFSTNHQLPTLDFAINHYGQPDVAMFDFTCMYASENAAMVRQRQGHNLLVALVGDSLLEVREREKRRTLPMKPCCAVVLGTADHRLFCGHVWFSM